MNTILKTFILYCGSRILLNMFPPMARSLFYFFKNYFLENDISHHLFLFYFFFLRENKIRKKNSKYDFLFRKDRLWKTKVGSGSQVTY